jgi:catechol 2,3-dioxygenase-like lactoylglutathione lyase family enzyme
MKLNHLNLSVPNVAETKQFFETYFEFTCVDEKGNNALVVLNGKDNFILTLMSDSFNKSGAFTYPNAFHFGFIFSTEAEVNSIYEKLKNGGITVEHEPGKIRNSYGFYFTFQDRLMIEIGHYVV